jgi:hypothetical protein
MKLFYLPSFILFLLLFSGTANANEVPGAEKQDIDVTTEHCANCGEGRSPGFSTPIVIDPKLIEKFPAGSPLPKNTTQIRDAAKRMIKSCYITNEELAEDALEKLVRENPGKNENEIALQYTERKKAILTSCLVPVVSDPDLRSQLVEEFMSYRLPSSKTSNIDELVDAFFARTPKESEK